ncbi:hypothetical protein BJ912DRAFT_1065610 [Pholiota molesta]|nr:hypothetical protein BJ912DRAFT_1065610 [Pholiota molesta]
MRSPKQLQTPFMRITLSTVERPELLLEGASYQPPAIRKQSKAAKARAKKQRAKAKRTTGAAATDVKIA